jgi:asparagine synthase (glutamine-hydrolysing)
MVDYVVAELGIRHTSIAVDAGSGMQHLRSLVKYHDEPVATVTYFVQWLLMKSISEHGYRVCISGTAADELFSGYYDHHLAYLYDVRHDKALFGDAVRSWTELVLPDIRSRHLRNPYLFINAPGFREHLYHDAEELRRYLTVEWNEPFTERHFTDSLLRNRMLNEMFHESVPVILHEEDLNAMFFSIENRSPYLDRELFELCFRIPTKHLVRNGFAKSVLRDAMRGIVPTRVLDNRCKVGFNAPVFSFLNTKDQETRSAILDGSSIFEHIRRDRVEELIEKESLHEGENKFLFSFLNSKIFLEEFSS